MVGPILSLPSIFAPKLILSSRDHWAQNDAVNKGAVKVYIGAPAASGPGMAHYVDAQQLGRIVLDTAKKYQSFGGVMLWDIYAAKSTFFLLSVHPAGSPCPDFYWKIIVTSTRRSSRLLP